MKMPNKPPGLFKKMVSGLVWLISLPGQLSIPAKITLALLVLLILIVGIAWRTFLSAPEHVAWQHYMTIGRIINVVALLIVIPLVFYYCLRLWIEKDQSQFPDLDADWRAGISALSEHGIDLQSHPIFLFFGADSEAQEAALMRASGLSLLVQNVSGNSRRLRWYADGQGIYLFCSDSSWLSGLSNLKKQKNSHEPVNSERNRLDQHITSPLPTAPAGSLMKPISPASASGNANRSTLQLGPSNESAPSSPTAAGSDGNNLRTLTIGQGMETPPRVGNLGKVSEKNDDEEATYGTNMEPNDSEPVILSAFAQSLQTRRLKYVCRRLRKERYPFCSVNGVVSLLPFELLSGSLKESEEVQRALKSDLTVIQQTLLVRSPVTTVVVGMEKLRGFRELVRRVGRERTLKQRFGGRHDLRVYASSEELRALSAHVCGAFEDWVYTLFREREGLVRSGNTQLYSLLCRVRCGLKARLGELLAEGVGHDSSIGSSEPTLFSGCYFASTGETPDRQAFVQSLFVKLLDEQELVEWSNIANKTEQRRAFFTYLSLLLNVGLVATLVVLYLFF